mgnify:FL=1
MKLYESLMMNLSASMTSNFFLGVDLMSSLYSAVVSKTHSVLQTQTEAKSKKAISRLVARVQHAAAKGHSHVHVLGTVYGKPDPFSNAKKQYFEKQGFTIGDMGNGFKISWSEKN